MQQALDTADRDTQGTASGLTASDLTASDRGRSIAGLPAEALTNVLDALSSPFLVINADSYEIEYANLAARHGRNPATTCFALSHGTSEPCDTSHHPCPLEEVRKTLRPVRVEHLHLDSNGEERVFEIHGYPILGQNGELTHLVESNVDITAQRQAESALRHSEAKFRHLWDCSPVMLCSIDGNGSIRDVNRRWLEETGYQREQVIGRRAEFLVRPRSARQAFARQVREAGVESASDGTSYTYERADGTAIEVATSYVETIDPAGRQICLAAAENITERRRTEKARELVESQGRLAAVGHLAAGIAHDFNNILQAIHLCGAQIQRAGEDAGSLSEDAATIVEQAERGGLLVRQIQDFCRQSVTNQEPLDLAPFLHGVVTLLKRTLLGGVRVVFETDVEQHLILGDRTQMQQTVTNLAINARDAMPDGGELRIGLSLLEIEEQTALPYPGMWPGKWVRIEVCDTGCGIPREARTHVFEPFFTTKPYGKGTGLGLSQVYGIVKQHGGFIDIDSDGETGTTFRLFFPRLLADTEPEVLAEQPPTLPRGNGESILVVEDQESLLRVISKTLTSFGYQVTATSSGTHALELCARDGAEYDLVLSDMMMPELDGRELFRRLRQGNRLARGLLMTGHFDDDDRPVEGVFERLQKPFSIKVLVEKVAAALRAP